MQTLSIENLANIVRPNIVPLQTTPIIKYYQNIFVFAIIQGILYNLVLQ